MKRLFFFLICCFPLALFGQGASPYAAQFWAQIRGTCQEGTLVMEKSIEEKGEDAVHPLETHVFEVACPAGAFTRIDKDEQEFLPGLDEFDFLFEYNCYNPYLKDYFDFKEENGVEAILRSDSEGETPLQKQIFRTDPNGTLRYSAAHIIKDNMLYDLEVNIEVWFQANGNYERHRIETFTRPSLRSGVRTIIEGRLK